MAGSWKLALLSAATLVALTQLNTANATLCAGQQQQGELGQQVQTDPCYTAFCRRYRFARCEVHRCMARFFVGSTDVTDHCEVDNCAVANGPDVECNGVCDIDPIDNRPVCNPTCDFNNGGCTDDEVCVEDRIFCVRAPCPQFLIRCENRRALCNGRPDPDACGAKERGFFYNASTQRCERFVFGTCDRTDNHFSTGRECRTACRGVPDVCFGSIRCPPGTRCEVGKDGEPFCDASCEYDNGGCEDDEICVMRNAYCITTPCPAFVECLSRKEVCTQAADVGPCKAALTRYFHNSVTRRCETFSYGGCGGNNNRFFTQEECEEACVPPENPCNLIDCRPGSTCRVNPVTGVGECVFVIDRCDLFPCDDGFRCRVNVLTNEPECVPNVNPCALILCGIPSICRVDPVTGEGRCGPNPCDTLSCSKLYECRYDPKSDEGVCVPTAPCLLKDCPRGQVCKLNEVTREGECAPPDLRCMIFSCPPGTVCDVDRDVRSTVRCVPDHPCAHLNCGSQICRIDRVSGTGYCGINPCILARCRDCQYNPETDDLQCGTVDPCATVLCSEDTVCRVDPENGLPECVDPCDDVECGTLTCRINSDNTAYCGLDPCTYTTCKTGQSCRYNRRRDSPECVTVDPCDTIRCAEGTRCEVDSGTGEARCVLDVPDIRCFLLRCPAGFTCQVSSDQLTVECVPDDPCQGRFCGELICRIDAVTRQPYCGLDPCTHTTCEPGSLCEYSPKLDTAVCVAPQTDPCENINCPSGKTCQLNPLGEAECVRSNTRCNGILCSGGDICRVNPTTGEEFCGITPCAFTTCPTNTLCEYDPTTDRAVCRDNGVDLCRDVRCDPFRRCEVQITATPACVPICRNILCGRPLVCRINSTTREPYCGDGPCRSFTCFNPQTECQYDAINDRPVCGPILTSVPDLCDPSPCPPNTQCVINSDSNPECRGIIRG